MSIIKRLCVFVSIVLIPGVVYGQAWVPQPGQVFFTLEYQYTDVRDHLFSDDVITEDGTNLGNAIDFGDIKGNTVAVSFDYGVFRNLALSGGLPFISSKYNGDRPENSRTDDGSYHGEFQDITISARYMFNVGRFAVTPLLTGVIPTHDYDTFGHAVPGRNMLEFSPGIAVGRTLFPLISSGYFAASYSYTITEEFGGIGTDRSNAFLSLGYLITRSFSASVTSRLQITHDGLDWIHDLDADNVHTHDRLAKASWFRLIGSVSYGVMENLTLGLSAGTMLWGENTHEATSISVSTSWGFGLY